MFSNSSNKQLISSLSQTLTNSIDDLSNNFSSSLEDNSQLIQTNANNIASTLSQISYVVDAEGEKDGDTIVFATGMGAPMEDKSGSDTALGLLVPTSGFLAKIFIASKGFTSQNDPLTFQIKVYDASGENPLVSPPIDISINGPKTILSLPDLVQLDPNGSQIVILFNKDDVDNSNNLVNWDDNSRFRAGFVIKPTDTFDGGSSDSGNQGPLNMASTEEAEYGFCVSYDNETIPDLSDGDIVPFNNASGLSDLTNSESAKLFSYPVFGPDVSGGFNTSTSEYVVPVSGNYMLGWNAFVISSSITNTLFDFQHNVRFDTDNLNEFITSLEREGFETNMSDYINDITFTRTNGDYPLITFNNTNLSVSNNGGTSHGSQFNKSTFLYIRYKLPDSAGSVKAQTGDGAGRLHFAILDKPHTESYTITQYKDMRGLTINEHTHSYNTGDYLYFATTGNELQLFKIDIVPTGGSSDGSTPVIRLEKNRQSLIEGGKYNAQNETRHIVNHLDKGDKLTLSVSGFFRLRGLKDTTFYGYLLNKDNAVSPTIVTSTTNLSVKTLSTLGDVTVGGQLLINDASNNLVDAVPRILSSSTFYGFQVTSDKGTSYYNAPFPFEFNLIPSNNNYYCIPDINHFDLVNYHYTVPVDGIYLFGISLTKRFLDAGDNGSGGAIGIYINSNILAETGANELNSGITSCTSWCQQGDTIDIRTTNSDAVEMEEGKSIFYGHLIQAMPQP